ncbi:MAG: site-specific integrase [Bacteroidales bacterium]
METNRCTTRVFIRKYRLNKDGKAPLLLRLTVNGRRWDSALKVAINPNDWDPIKEKATGDDNFSNLVNDTIESIKFRIHKIKLSMEDEGKTITLEGIKNKFLDKDKNHRTILALFQKHNEECEMKVGVQVTYSTYERYKTCYKHVKEFLKKEYKVEDLPVSEINRRLYDRFKYYLKKEKKCAHNTTVKYIRNFNKIVRIAVEQGWLTKTPYREIGYRLEEIDKAYLTQEELTSIIEKDISIKRLDIVRDLFVFCCHTGLAFSDIKELTDENIQIGVDKNMWIIKKRKKTNIVSKIPLLDTPARIIEKYKNYPRSSNVTTLLSVPSNQKMNAYLKEIGDITEIKKILTTHTARRTFATTIMLHNGVSMEAVSKMLGHTSLFMTRKYAKVDEYYIAQETEKVRKIFMKRN